MRRIIVSVILLSCCSSLAAQTPIDTGVTVRNSIMRDAPTLAGEEVGPIATGTDVNVFERQRLWVRIAPLSAEESDGGWVRFTELRFGQNRVTETPTESPKSGGFAGFSRSVSGFLGSFRGRNNRAANTTSTIGIRGLTVAELESAQANPGAVAIINQYTMSREEAEQFAAAGGLSARDVSYGGAAQ